MFNIFEKPWALLGLSIIVLFAVMTIRSFLPEKRWFWQWLIPLLVALSAFGIDFLVSTDNEKINNITSLLLNSLENENSQVVKTCIAENYSDSVHRTKDSLMTHCEQILSEYEIRKIKQTGILVNISGENAKATLFLWVYFDEDSYVAQNYKSFIQIKVELYFQKQPAGKWLINRTEVLEIDKQTFRWSNIR